mmetsp:Transcript_49088/g.123027  ORF Transcript_49088/g.123027 Transcript_49088/m.123027 type:complete len:293 (+) Transcript_49088:712-1590(+)
MHTHVSTSEANCSLSYTHSHRHTTPAVCVWVTHRELATVHQRRCHAPLRSPGKGAEGNMSPPLMKRHELAPRHKQHTRSVAPISPHKYTRSLTHSFSQHKTTHKCSRGSTIHSFINQSTNQKPPANRTRPQLAITRLVSSRRPTDRHSHARISTWMDRRNRHVYLPVADGGVIGSSSARSSSPHTTASSSASSQPSSVLTDVLFFRVASARSGALYVGIIPSSAKMSWLPLPLPLPPRDGALPPVGILVLGGVTLLSVGGSWCTPLRTAGSPPAELRQLLDWLVAAVLAVPS